MACAGNTWCSSSPNRTGPRTPGRGALGPPYAPSPGTGEPTVVIGLGEGDGAPGAAEAPGAVEAPGMVEAWDEAEPDGPSDWPGAAD